MTLSQKHFFDNMMPGATLTPNQTKDWAATIRVAKQYIDQVGPTIYFDDAYQVLTKQQTIPPTNDITWIWSH